MEGIAVIECFGDEGFRDFFDKFGLSLLKGIEKIFLLFLWKITELGSAIHVILK
jgi:hypothetical protein